MGSIVSGVTDAIGLTDSDAGQRAADASHQASQTAAAYDREALDYIKQTGALPMEFRDKALQQYGDVFLGGGLQAPTEQQIMSNPLYKSILGTQGDAESAVLRNQAMTGGFRSGDTQAGLANTAADIKRNALLAGYQDEQNMQRYNMAGLQGLAQMPTNANQIAAMTSGIGQTLAQGQVAGAQAQMQGNQANAGNLLGLGQLALGAAAFSDDRLKDNLVVIKETAHPDINKYKWEWNDKANELGMTGEDSGYLASEIQSVWPELVVMDGSGYRKINIGAIEKKLGDIK